MTYLDGLSDLSGSQRQQWSRWRLSLLSSQNRISSKSAQADMLLICLIALRLVEEFGRI